jgi:membrane-bound lytic murein transglycosylase MltF
MKQTFISIITAALVAVAFIFILQPRSGVPAPAHKESAYDRVMRTGVLKCGYYPWPGTAELDPNTQELTGLMPELTRTLGRMLDLKVEYVQMSGQGMEVQELKSGRYDAACVSSYYVFSMGKFVDFSTPYAYFPMFAYGRADDQRFKNLTDLNDPDVTFVGADGDISVTLVGYQFPKAKLVTLAATSDATALTINVATNKADVTLIDPGLAATYNANNPDKLKMLDPAHPVAVYPVGFSVAKGEDKLLRMLDSAVSAMANTGMLTPVLDRYMAQGGVAWPVAPGYLPQPLK